MVEALRPASGLADSPVNRPPTEVMHKEAEGSREPFVKEEIFPPGTASWGGKTENSLFWIDEKRKNLVPSLFPTEFFRSSL